ncbi:TPR-like protein, partial [Aureobasidium melanogenum]
MIFSTGSHWTRFGSHWTRFGSHYRSCISAALFRYKASLLPFPNLVLINKPKMSSTTPSANSFSIQMFEEPDTSGHSSMRLYCTPLSTSPTNETLITHRNKQFSEIHLENIAIDTIHLDEFLGTQTKQLKKVNLINTSMHFLSTRDGIGEPCAFLTKIVDVLHHTLEVKSLEIKDLGNGKEGQMEGYELVKPQSSFVEMERWEDEYGFASDGEDIQVLEKKPQRKSLTFFIYGYFLTTQAIECLLQSLPAICVFPTILSFAHDGSNSTSGLELPIFGNQCTTSCSHTLCLFHLTKTLVCITQFNRCIDDNVPAGFTLRLPPRLTGHCSPCLLVGIQCGSWLLAPKTELGVQLPQLARGGDKGYNLLVEHLNQQTLETRLCRVIFIVQSNDVANHVFHDLYINAGFAISLGAEAATIRRFSQIRWLSCLSVAARLRARRASFLFC